MNVYKKLNHEFKSCWLALELGSTDSPALPEAVTWLSDPNSASAEPRAEFGELVDFITTRIENLSPEQITRGGDAIIGVLEKTTDVDAQIAAGKSLVPLGSKTQLRLASAYGRALRRISPMR